jgi:glycosyltransferase involved in cell wall biosynthesis
MSGKVLILQEQVPPYRVPFFRVLADELDRRQLDLRVVSSSALPAADVLGFQHQRTLISRGGLSALDTIYRERPAFLVLPHSARFAPVAAAARLLQTRGRRQLLWGMGMARRYGIASASDSHHLTPKAMRRFMLSACDHYLSYTQFSTTNLTNRGYNAAKITTLNNAVEALARPEQAIKASRVPYQVLFVASLAEDKEPLAAVAIIDQLRLIAPGTTLHIVGDGPLRAECEHAADERDWVRYHGPQHGSRLRELALASDIALIPGRVGLAVLEMASAGLPMATFAASLHGAEIAYLSDGVNGLFLSSEISVAANQLGTLITDRQVIERMRLEALDTAGKYTVRNMAANFANGIVASMHPSRFADGT